MERRLGYMSVLGWVPFDFGGRRFGSGGFSVPDFTTVNSYSTPKMTITGDLIVYDTVNSIVDSTAPLGLRYNNNPSSIRVNTIEEKVTNNGIQVNHDLSLMSNFYLQNGGSSLTYYEEFTTNIGWFGGWAGAAIGGMSINRIGRTVTIVLGQFVATGDGSPAYEMVAPGAIHTRFRPSFQCGMVVCHAYNQGILVMGACRIEANGDIRIIRAVPLISSIGYGLFDSGFVQQGIGQHNITISYNMD